jgi:hypothetical protein
MIRDNMNLKARNRVGINMHARSRAQNSRQIPLASRWPLGEDTLEMATQSSFNQYE